MAPSRERTSALAGTVIRSLRAALKHDLLVHRGEDDKAFLIRLHKPVHALVLILIVAHFLPYAPQVEANGRVRNDHLETEFAHFLSKHLDLFRCLFVSVIDGESLLDLICEVCQHVIC